MVYELWESGLYGSGFSALCNRRLNRFSHAATSISLHGFALLLCLFCHGESTAWPKSRWIWGPHIGNSLLVCRKYRREPSGRLGTSWINASLGSCLRIVDDISQCSGEAI